MTIMPVLTIIPPAQKTTTKNHQRMSNSQWFNVK